MLMLILMVQGMMMVMMVMMIVRINIETRSGVSIKRSQHAEVGIGHGETQMLRRLLRH